LVYTALMSVDGYIEDRSGRFDWAAPDEEVHRFVNDRERGIGTYLYGRRMYETMRYWQTPQAVESQPPFIRDYAEIWRAADKVVFSQSLDDVSTPRTTLVRDLDPSLIRGLKATSDHDISIGGPTLATHAFRAGLVDQCHLFVSPVAVGGGKPALPPDVQLNLQLVDERRSASGVVHLHYLVTT
jgi:dihydrofolate reductase